MAQAVDFRFALLTDIHLSRSNHAPLADLRRSIDEINSLDSVAFVVASGDITEAGDRESMEVAKREFNRLRVPYYIVSGNHETTWSESGCTDFAKVFGADRFAFRYEGIQFIGFNSGPVLKMADGHVAPQDLHWADSVLASCPKHMPVIAITHYPLREGDVDNWYEATSMLRRYRTQCVIGGHYHRNLHFNADGIPNILCRSNLHDKDGNNGYSLISVSADSIRFAEKRIGEPAKQWDAVPVGKPAAIWGKPLPRPSFAVNRHYRQVREAWRVQVGAGIYSAPAMADGLVYIGDDLGLMHAYDYHTGRERWTFPTGSRINSTPAIADGKLVFGSTDGRIYCLSADRGELLWFVDTDVAVMGCPVVAQRGNRNVVLIGANKKFFCIGLDKGDLCWERPIEGYCVSRPCVSNGHVFFGAWGCYFYSLDIRNGDLMWHWSNGSSNDKFSPAAVWPVVSHGKVFLVAPDRYFTCLDEKTGKEIYRTNQHKVRENIGLSTDGNVVFSRCMNDSVQAMSALSDTPVTLWKRSADYGYDHDPSMMLERDGVIIFGTRNGLMHGIDATNGDVLWRHKIGNCVVNTICPVSGNDCLITSSDGSVIRLHVKSKKSR